MSDVRQQIALDGTSRYRFAGDNVRTDAEKLREEMEGRRLQFTPIDWPANPCADGRISHCIGKSSAAPKL